MITSPELVERVARQMWFDTIAHGRPWDGASQYTREACLDRARSVLAVIKAQAEQPAKPAPVIDVDKVLADGQALIDMLGELNERIKATLAAGKAEPATPEPVAVHPLAGEVAELSRLHLPNRHSAVAERCWCCTCGVDFDDEASYVTHHSTVVAEFVEGRTTEGVEAAIRKSSDRDDTLDRDGAFRTSADIAANYRATA